MRSEFRFRGAPVLARRSLCGLAAAFLSAAFFTGCAPSSDVPELGQVTGTVTLDGTPLTGVMILFKPEEGRPATGLTDASGQYQLEYLYGHKGCKTGPNTVSFMYETGAEGGRPIPEKYSSKSQETREVFPGPNTFDFELTSK